MILASALLHLPVSPIVLLLSFLGLLVLREPDPTDVAPDSLNAIPIDLLQEDERSPRADESLPRSELPDDDVAVEDVTPVADAGVPENADATIEDAGDAAIEDAGDAAIEDAGEGGSGPGIADAEPAEDIRNPVALAAERTKVVDSNAAVSLTLYSESFRKHPMSSRIGRLLSRLPQWQDFFGSSGLDPVAHIDRMMLVGPDFRDSSGLAVLVQHRLPNARIYEAINALVKRPPGGQWLDAGVPAAQAHADRAERVFVIPSSYLVIVAPLTARDSALTVPRTLRIPDPEGDEALVGVLKSPGYAFQKSGAPITIPGSISSIKYWVSPLPDGGARAHFIAQDSSAPEARRNLQTLKDQIDSLKTLGSLAGLGAVMFKDQAKGSGLDAKDLAIFVAVLNRLNLTVHEDEIHGSLDAPQTLLEALIARVEEQFGIHP